MKITQVTIQMVVHEFFSCVFKVHSKWTHHSLHFAHFCFFFLPLPVSSLPTHTFHIRTVLSIVTSAFDTEHLIHRSIVPSCHSSTLLLHAFSLHQQWPFTYIFFAFLVVCLMYFSHTHSNFIKLPHFTPSCILCPLRLSRQMTVL